MGYQLGYHIENQANEQTSFMIGSIGELVINPA
jgi:hypothetical protein